MVVDMDIIIFLRRGRSFVIVGVLLLDSCVWPVICVRVKACDGISVQESFIWVPPVSLGPLEGS